jgi:CO dehydrogenase/acetyl-CoA synthase alpha subunit
MYSELLRKDNALLVERNKTLVAAIDNNDEAFNRARRDLEQLVAAWIAEAEKQQRRADDNARLIGEMERRKVFASSGVAQLCVIDNEGDLILKELNR